MKNTHVTRILFFLVVVVFMPCRIMGDSPSGEKVCASALAVHGKTSRSTQQQETTLRETPVTEVLRGVSYEQCVGQRDLPSRFELRLDAPNASGLLTEYPWSTSQLVMHDTRTGDSACLAVGGSLHLALGCMNQAAVLLAHGKSLQDATAVIRQCLAVVPDKGGKRIPETEIYRRMPCRQPPVRIAANREARRMLSQLFGPPSLTGTPGTKFTGWNGEILFQGKIVNYAKSGDKVYRNLVKNGGGRALYRLRQNTRSGRWILESPSRQVIFDSRAEAALWKQILENHLLDLSKQNLVQEMSEAMAAGEYPRALRCLAQSDPLWAHHLRTLPFSQHAEVLDTYLSNLPALCGVIEDLMAAVHKQYPLLGEYLEEIYFSGDALKRRGLFALQAFLAEQGCIAKDAVDYGKECQIIWGLKYLLGQDPKDFPYQSLLQFTKPLPEPHKSWRETLNRMVKTHRTQMTYGELQEFFANLSHPDPKKRASNLLSAVKVALPEADAGKLLFNAIASHLEECIDNKTSLLPLLDSLRILLWHYREWVRLPLLKYVRSSTKNPVAKNIFVLLFAETQDPVFAKELLAMYRSPRLFGAMPREWLIRNILRTGQMESIRGLLQTILENRSPQHLEKFSSAWALAPQGILDFQDLQGMCEMVHRLLLDKRQRWSDSFLLQMGASLSEIGNVSAPPAADRVDRGMGTALETLRASAQSQAMQIFNDLWEGRQSPNIRLAAADGLIRFYEQNGETKEAAFWTAEKRALAQALKSQEGKQPLPNYLEELFQTNTMLQDIAERDVLYRRSRFKQDLRLMEVLDFQRLRSRLPSDSDFSLGLVRTSLNGTPFKDFLLLYQQGRGHETESVLSVFVANFSKEPRCFVELPKEYRPLVLEKISLRPPSDSPLPQEIFLPLYFWDSLHPAFAQRAKEELLSNLFARHLLDSGKSAGLSTAGGMLAIGLPGDIRGNYFSFTHSIMNKIGRKAMLEGFVHGALHHIYATGLNLSQREQNRAYFSRRFGDKEHPLLEKIRTCPLFGNRRQQRPDSLYEEALAFTAQAIAQWQTVSYFGTPVLFSDIEHLNKLGLLPPAMKLDASDERHAGDPVDIAYFQKVLDRLATKAGERNSPEDARIVAYHRQSLQRSKDLATMSRSSGLAGLFIGRLGGTAFRNQMLERLDALFSIGLQDSSGEVRSIMEFIADKIAQVETREGRPLTCATIALRGDILARKKPAQMEIFAVVQGIFPARPVSFLSTDEKLNVVAPGQAFSSLRKVKVTVLGSDGADFLQHESVALWGNSVVLCGLPLRTPSTLEIRKFLENRLAGLSEKISKNPWSAIWDAWDIYLKMDRVFPNPQMQGDLFQIGIVATDLEETLPENHRMVLQDLLRGWQNKALAWLPRRSPLLPEAFSEMLHGNLGEKIDEAMLARAKENLGRVSAQEQKSLCSQFLQELAPDQIKALETQKIQLLFSAYFGTEMLREGKRIYLDRALMPLGDTASENHNRLRRKIYRALMAHALSCEDLSWEEKLYAVCKELDELTRLSPQDMETIRTVILPLWGVLGDKALLDKYLALAKIIQTHTWQNPHIINPLSLSIIVPFAAQHYSVVAQANSLDGRGYLRADKAEEIFSLLDIHRLQEDEAYRNLSMTRQTRRYPTEEEWASMTRDHWKTRLSTMQFLRTAQWLKEDLSSPYGIPMVYRFALSPSTFVVYQELAQKNPALLDFLQRPEVVKAAYGDFLRIARLSSDNPLRKARELPEMLQRAESETLLPHADLPWGDPGTSLLLAAGGTGSFVAAPMEKVAQENNGKTAAITVTDCDPLRLQEGICLRDPSLCFAYLHDDISASNMQSDSMDTAVLRGFADGLFRGRSWMDMENFRALLSAFGNLNRILKTGKRLYVIDAFSYADLLKYFAGLYGFKLIQEQRVQDIFQPEDCVVLTFVEEAKLPVLAQYTTTWKIKGGLENIREILAQLPKTEPVEFSLDDTVQHAHWADAFRVMLDGLIHGKTLRLSSVSGKKLSFKFQDE